MDCWLYAGTITNGYGIIDSTHNGKLLRNYAHRLMYEAYRGKIPKGLVIDHKCRVKRCVNPAHLRAVTSKENTLAGYGVAGVNARKTHCNRGHEFTPENTFNYQGKDRKQARRRCKTCNTLRVRAWRLKQMV